MPLAFLHFFLAQISKQASVVVVSVVVVVVVVVVLDLSSPNIRKNYLYYTSRTLDEQKKNFRSLLLAKKKKLVV